MIKKTSFIILFFIMISSFAEAKNLYVNNSGSPACSDATTYANNNEANPWCTIGRAAWGSTNRSAPNPNQAAQAGDTVIVKAGTYSTTGTGVRYDPAYNPINTGTISAPIVFQAEGMVTLTQTGEGPVIGANGNHRTVNYITWKGFTIIELNALSTSDTGPAVLWSTTGSRIENCVIDGEDNGRLGNNHNGIRIDNTWNVVLRNNRIYNVKNFGTYHHNGAGIMAYFSRGALIEHNEIYNCGSGIFIKGGDNESFTVRYNLCRNNGKGIVTMYTSAEGVHKIYQNIIRDNFEIGISVEIESDNVSIVNNTVVNNVAGGIRFGWCGGTFSNIRIQNNIVVGSPEAINGGECGTATPFWFDYNNYYNNSRGWSIAGIRYTTIASWRTALDGCPGTGNDCGAITSNPLFVDEANNNYKLQAGSPARTLGRTITEIHGSSGETIPAGAYITGNEVIGRIVSTFNSPSPPRALTIQ